MLVAIIGVLLESVVPMASTSGSEAVQVLNRLGVDWSTALAPVIEQVRQSPADVNERRRQGFFPMLSMIGHPPGDKPLMMDVCQSGSGPQNDKKARCRVDSGPLTSARLEGLEPQPSDP
jgi:hypothetical protein